MSNLKQMGLGILMYTQDYDESLPFASVATTAANLISDPPACGTWNSISRYWPQIIYPYTKNCQINICPSVSAYNRLGSVGQFISGYAPNLGNYGL